MNSLNKSILSFIKKDCIVAFGNEKGMKIYTDSALILTELSRAADFRNSKAVENICAISFYLKLHFTERCKKMG